MPKYDVHIYALVRVKVPSVVARTPTDAAKAAAGKIDLDYAFRSGEFADEIAEFMVDRVDKDHMVVATHNLDGKFKRLRNRG